MPPEDACFLLHIYAVVIIGDAMDARRVLSIMLRGTRSTCRRALQLAFFSFILGSRPLKKQQMCVHCVKKTNQVAYIHLSVVFFPSSSNNKAIKRSNMRTCAVIYVRVMLIRISHKSTRCDMLHVAFMFTYDRERGTKGD